MSEQPDHDGITDAYNPATMSREALCKGCGELVASMTREIQTEMGRAAGMYWLGLLLTGGLNHRNNAKEQ